MPRIDVETGGLRAAGGSAQDVGSTLRGLAGEIMAALADVGSAAPPESASAGTGFAHAMQTGAMAVGEGVETLGGHAQSAADAYDVVDARAMPNGPAVAR